MLKIKDNVDLKELEKFGFEIIGGLYGKTNLNMAIEIRNNKLDITCDDCYFDKNINECIEWLYDLIKADLVEKVSDDNG